MPRRITFFRQENQTQMERKGPQDIAEITQVLADFGTCLVACQLAEKTMCFALTFIFRSDPIGSTAQIQETVEQLSRSTLGALIRRLKKHVELHDRFERHMQVFLDDRNRLAHRIDDIADLSTQDGRKIAREFAARLVDRAETTTKIFAAICYQWAEAIGYEGDLNESVRAWVGSPWMTHATMLFRAKDR